MPQSDEELVIAYLEKGDQKAFNTLLNRHQERIFGYLMGMVRDVDVANDLFQDTFLRIISALQARRGSYQQQNRFVYWAMRIARNTALDYLRTRKKWKDVGNHEDDEDSFWDRLPDFAPDALDLIQDVQQNEWLEECIAQLSHDQREVLLLRHDAGLSFKEIAELTGCSINTALGRMRYALLNIQKMLVASGKQQLIEL